MSLPPQLLIVAEDVLSLEVLKKVLIATGRAHDIFREVNERGFGNIRKGIPKYLGASRGMRHVVLTDLDQAPCAPGLRRDWGVAEVPEGLQFRVAVRETEAWLLADRAGFAQFAKVDVKKVPAEPERLPDPKQALVNLVRGSRSKRLAAEIVPPQGGSRVSMGPFYNERLSEFVREHWDVSVAAEVAPSLLRTVERLRSFL